MHLHQLKYFVAIVENGSVTKAAEACFTSQPSISQQLGKLEDSIGKKLFSRVKGKLLLTDAGKVMYQQAIGILGKVEEAKRRVNDIDGTDGGMVAVGILPTLAPFILPKALVALSKKFPKATISIREDISEEIVEASIRGELDIIIDALPISDDRLSIEPLFSEDFYVAVHRDNPLAKLKEISVNDLNDLPFILLEDIHCMTKQVEEYCFNRDFVPKVLFQASQIATIKQLIELQYGVSILPRITIDDNTESCIRYIRFEGTAPSRDIVMAVGKDRYLSPAAECFVSTVRNEYQHQAVGFQ